MLDRGAGYSKGQPFLSLRLVLLKTAFLGSDLRRCADNVPSA
jgi:hypothetical protein